MHQEQPVLTAGAPLEKASKAVVLVHGRGGNARDILQLSGHFGPELAYLAPQAENHTWYPYSFLHPLQQNEPYLSQALDTLTGVVQHLQDQGFQTEQIHLGGFSQGACLALEFLARSGSRFGGAFAFSGGLIGPEGTPRDYPGNLQGTPVFIGCSDRDSHIPLWRVKESTEVLTRLGATVDERIYPGMPHTIIADEIEAVRQMLQP